MANHETTINSLFGSDSSFENIFNSPPTPPFPLLPASPLQQFNSEPETPIQTHAVLNQYVEDLPHHSISNSWVFASLSPRSTSPPPLPQNDINHMTNVIFDNTNINFNASLEKAQSHVQPQPAEEAQFLNLEQSAVQQHVGQGMPSEEGNQSPFPMTSHIEHGHETSTSSTDSVPSLDSISVFNITQAQSVAEVGDQGEEMDVDRSPSHNHDNSGLPIQISESSKDTHPLPNGGRSIEATNKPVNELLYIEHTYCNVCSVSLISDTKSTTSVFCIHCGHTVPVDKQYLHPCIHEGNAKAVCAQCANVSSIPGSPMSATSVGATVCSVAKKRGRKARCGKCGVICASAAEKRHHMATVHSTDFQCEQCNAVLRSAENLRRHMMCHGPDPQHWCAICGAGFTQTRGWRVHQAECGKVRNYLGVQRKVIVKRSNGACKIDSDKRFKCPECGDRFSVRPSVSRHIRIKHRGERPYNCEFCTRSFTSKYNKKVHVMKSHKDHA